MIAIDSTYEAADAILILTEWQDYENVNWLKVSKKMRSANWVFDTRGLVNPKDMQDININFWQIGNSLNS